MIEEDAVTRIANPGPAARYELLVPIASGGMATVYVGRQFGAGGFQRLVAIKRMHPHISQSPELAGMFRDESRIASLIHHPNVVAIIDVYESSGEQLLVMDYVDGVSLGQLRKALREQGTPFPPRVALRIMVDALRGLHAAHEQKDMDGAPLEVVHRDATPQNILLGTDGAIKVTDFGIARATERSSVTEAGQAKGKFAFMAPEQCAGGVMDRRVDVFSMGVVLWELIVGRPLFRGQNDAIIIGQITAGKYPRAIEVSPKVPKKLDAIVMTAVSPKADDRYPTAAAFADALETYGPEIDGLATHEEVGALVTAVSGERILKRRHDVHEVLGGRKPKVSWGVAAGGHGTGSHSFVRLQSGSTADSHLGGALDINEPMPDFKARSSAVRFAIWIGGALVAAAVVIAILAALLPPADAEVAATTPSAPTVTRAPVPPPVDPRIHVRIEADAEIIELRVPEGNDVEIDRNSATFTAARGTTPIEVAVKFDDGSEVNETVTPTANAVIKVRRAAATVAPKPPGGGRPGAGYPTPAPTPPGGGARPGPKFQDDPYQ